MRTRTTIIGLYALYVVILFPFAIALPIAIEFFEFHHYKHLRTVDFVDAVVRALIFSAVAILVRRKKGQQESSRPGGGGSM